LAYINSIDEIVPLTNTLASLLNRKLPLLLLTPHATHHLRPDTKIMKPHHLAQYLNRTHRIPFVVAPPLHAAMGPTYRTMIHLVKGENVGK